MQQCMHASVIVVDTSLPGDFFFFLWKLLDPLENVSGNEAL